MIASQLNHGFAHEIDVFIQTAQSLGRFRYEGQRSQFEEMLSAVGMDVAEVPTYWDLVAVYTGQNAWAPINNGSIQNVKSNTQLAAGLGIDLKNGDGQPPRNWLLYRLFELHFPGMLHAVYSGKTHLRSSQAKQNVPPGQRVNPDHRIILFDELPLEPCKGNPLAIHRVVQGLEPARFRSEVLRTAGPLRTVLGDDLGTAFADVLFSLQMLIPSEGIARVLKQVLDAGRSGQKVTLAGAFCPDYAYVSTGNPHVPYKYTFDGLGEGVGLVARQFARIIPSLSRFFRTLGIEHEFVIGIGDFEADSDKVLARVGVDRTEFIRRCQCSLNEFQKLMPADVPITLELFDEVRGRGEFRQYATRCTERMLAGDFGMMRTLHSDLDDVILRIPHQYRTFYERWYGMELGDRTVRHIVYSQGGEYAAVAGIYRRDLGDNLIFLAGDRPEMNRFNAFDAPLPVLCAKRAY